jgi:hypothetical protein
MKKRLVLAAPWHSPCEQTLTFESFNAQNILKEASMQFTMLRKLNFLVFKVNNSISLVDFFVRFMTSIGHDEFRAYGVCAVRFSQDEVVVAISKDDQCRVTLPSGLIARWIVPPPKGGSGKVDYMSLLCKFTSTGAETVSNMCVRVVSDVNALDIITTAREMSKNHLLFARLQAQMTAPKSRSPWQVALVTGWESISKLTEDTQAHNVFVIHVGSGVWPAMKKLKDYSDDAAGRSFNNLNEKLECR